MSIRVLVLMIMVAALAVYAWRDWFKALCGLIVMMAVFNHPDMPRSMAGIPGLNPWNALMGVIVLAWLVGRNRDRLRWTMDRRAAMLLILFVGMMLIGFGIILNHGRLPESATELTIEYGLNTFKWLIPAVLLFDGCRTRKQVSWVVVSLAALHLLLALQAIKYAPMNAAFDRGTLETSRRVIFKNTGYHTCDLGPVLAGAAWALFASMRLFAKRWLRVGCFACGMLASYGMVVCGARAGMLAWVVTGLVFCLLRWRKLLLLAPVAPILVFLALPGFADRMLSGFGETDITGQEMTNAYEATSGRAVVWPMMLDAVWRAPVVGYGRRGFVTSGVAEEIAQTHSVWPHPHNMFLQVLLDNGFIGAIPAFLLFGYTMMTSATLLRVRGDPLMVAAGGWAVALIVALLVGGVGAMTFYPRESLMGMFCAMLLALRVRELRSTEQAARRLRSGVSAWRADPVVAAAHP